MLRYDDINDISDGKLYGADDMVKADTAGCAGCSKCCESDMGDTIVLDPFDIYNMTLATGKSFDELLTSFQVELGMKDTIILPHLKMDKGCTFLNDEKRCSIHKRRPSICRLFPLGRIYNEKGFDYFLQIGECEKEDRTEVRVRDWLGIDDLDGHSAFIMKWHRFIKFEFQGEPVEDDRIFTVGLEKFHYSNTKESFDIDLKDLDKNHPSREVATDCRKVLEEMLQRGQHQDISGQSREPPAVI